MRKLLLFLLTTVMLCFSLTANAAFIKGRPVAVVLEMGEEAIMSDGLQRSDFRFATHAVLAQVAASQRFALVSYSQLNNIARVHQINMSGMIDETNAVRLGNIAAAKFMIVPTLTGLTSKNSDISYQHGTVGSIGNSRYKVTANVAIQVIDLETGIIVAAGMGNGSSTSSSSEITFNKYISDFQVLGQDPSINDEAAEDDVTIDAGRYGMNGQAPIEYKVKIGTSNVTETQVRNAVAKAVKDAVFGDFGIITMANGGKKVKIKTPF